MTQARHRLVPRFILSVIMVLAGCDHNYDKIAGHRQEYARINLGDIAVAVIDEPSAETYLNGARLAAKQVNERPGKLLGRRVEIVAKSGGMDIEEAQDSILDIAADERVVAVLGHGSSAVAIPASVIYEASRIIFMPPYATAKGLTAHDFKFVFRMVPNSSIMAEQIASVAELLGYKNIALLYAQDDDSRELAFLFEDAAIERGMGFVHRRSFSGDETDYRELITQFSNKPVDMVFMATGPLAGARMIRQLREMGVKAPVMGSDALNTSSFSEAVGTAGDNTIVPMVYHSQTATHSNREFQAGYRALFGEEPDQSAAQGYDSLGLLAAAIEQARSTVPTLIASTLHYLPYWTGVTGVHAFDTRGEVSGKKYFFQVLRDGKWNFLPAVHLPYFLERFDRLVKNQENGRNGTREFRKSFSTNLHPDDLRILQLDFLHAILQFPKLGVIYGEETPGQIPDKLTRIMALGEKRGFETKGCGVAVSNPDKQQVERQLLDCYGKLSITVNALNVTGLRGIDKDTVARLQRPLKEYKIPVLALQGDTEFEAGMAIGIGRFGDKQNIQTDYYLDLFGGILHGVKMYELAERLNNLPVLAVNLKLLNDYGLLRSGTLVGLAPDLYLEWLVTSK